MLIQIRRALKPDGLMLAALLGGDTLAELRESFGVAESELTGGVSPRVAPFADLRDLGALLQRAGFELPVTDVDRVVVRYSSPLALMADLRRMTADLVRRFTDFPSLEDYLDGYAITGEKLGQLKVPARIITSLDDPIIPAHSLQRLARAASLQLTVTRHGGHCGFLERLSGPSWVERKIVEEFETGAPTREGRAPVLESV